jgi:hypothetical protein
MPSVKELLDLADIGYEPYARVPAKGIYITTANQLIGSYADERAFVHATKEYRGWQAHHVVETQDLGRLHIHDLSPSRDDQLCVLLPERAHVGRINSILRNRVPLNEGFSPSQLLSAYNEAYSVMGDYCGGGENLIRRELLAIVRATFKAFSLI